MPCILTVIALATPRFVIIILWLFTHWFRGVFDHAVWPVLGFFVLPTTVLWYSVVHNWFGGQWTLWPVLGLIAALMIDLGPFHRRRSRDV